MTADTSETGIANEALSAAEIPSTLASLDQPNSKAARVCRLHLPNVRDEILRSYAFGFSSDMLLIPALSTLPAGGTLQTAYQMPVDALRILRIDGLNKRQWRTTTDKRILASATGSVVVHFIKSIGDFTRWDALARQMMILQLAIRISPELNRHRGIKQSLQSDWKYLEAQAEKIDAFEQDSEQDDTDYDAWVPSYIAARF